MQDLKSIQRYNQKVSSYGGASASSAAARQSMAAAAGGALPPPSGLARTSTNPAEQLIRAVHPYQAQQQQQQHRMMAADSRPGLGYATPRDMGGEGEAAMQQQQLKQALPPGPLLQQHYVLQQSLARLGSGLQGREGGGGGGLAGLAGKVMSGVGSPLDRLRRLSSGQFQQQQQAAAAQQQPQQRVEPPHY